jgi:hypothetical protein
MEIGVLSGLPAGQYVVTAKARFNAASETSSFLYCSLTVSDGDNLGEPFTDQSAAVISSVGATTLPFLAAGSLLSEGAAVLSCEGDNVFAAAVKITAIQVGSLTVLSQP